MGLGENTKECFRPSKVNGYMYNNEEDKLDLKYLSKRMEREKTRSGFIVQCLNY